MRFKRLAIMNLRAVESFEIDGLNDFVVIAGQNGCGKSCIFDAIRLLKSLYGGYSANEHLQWFGEFAINLQDQVALRKIFREPSKPMEVSASLEFSAHELTYVKENIERLAMPIAWQRVTSQPVDHYTFNRMALATQYDHLKPLLDEQIGQIREVVLRECDDPVQKLSVVVDINGNLGLEPCLVAQLVFQAYEPENFGIIDYHSASRAYARQDIGGINLDPKAFEEQRRQHGLYNWQAKYQNVKSELASAYLRGLISRSADDSVGEETDGRFDDLNQTLKELFETFFPDKTYSGPKALATGNLEFPVKLASGRTHDIDDLSSGEKEILYGYLRLRNSTPRRSIILLDEPELHLNPSLLQGFTDFYYRHLGIGQENQLWMVTHSDALLRQAVGNSKYDVFHMTPASVDDSGANQASRIFLDDDLERAIVDLVGDLAAYQPHSKVVIFEGDGENGFDVNMVRRLFPQFPRRANLVSGGNKPRVRGLYAILSDFVAQAGVLNRFYAVTDRDHEIGDGATLPSHQRSWDRYHIENYLLEPQAIMSVVNSANRTSVFASEDEVLDALKNCASELVEGLIIELLQRDLNRELVNLIRIKGDPNPTDYAEALFPSVEATFGRMESAKSGFTRERLQQMGSRHAEHFRSSLESGNWIADFPGRNILRRFVDKHVVGITYEPFINLLLDNMVERNVEPEGMRVVLESIANA